MRRSLRISMFNELLRVSTNSHAPSLQVFAHGSRCEHMRVSATGPCALEAELVDEGIIASTGVVTGTRVA